MDGIATPVHKKGKRSPHRALKVHKAVADRAVVKAKPKVVDAGVVVTALATASRKPPALPSVP